MKAIYDINYNRLAVELLPTFLRNSQILALMKHAGAAVKWLHGRFKIFRVGDLFRESIDSTIPRLEFLLNTMFYSAGLDVAYDYRIVVSGTKKATALHIWQGGLRGDPEDRVDEGRPQWLNPTQYIYTSRETGEIPADFVVKVPDTVEFDEARMRALLKCYALPGKGFEIIKY